MNLTLATLAARPPFFSKVPRLDHDKRCRTCLEDKGPKEFGKNGNYADGLDTECLACRRIRAKAARQAKKVVQSGQGVT